MTRHFDNIWVISTQLTSNYSSVNHHSPSMGIDSPSLLGASYAYSTSF